MLRSKADLGRQDAATNGYSGVGPTSIRV